MVVHHAVRSAHCAQVEVVRPASQFPVQPADHPLLIQLGLFAGRLLADRVAELSQAPVFARIPIDPRKAQLADEGRVEEIDDPICDQLADALLASLAAHPKPKEMISLV